MVSESEFYVGYLPIPGGLRTTIRRIILALALLALIAAAILVAGQHAFAPAIFEFQQYGEFRGTLLAEPYPALAIPGQGLPWLLVGPGKHGVGDLRDLDGREVVMKGERIFRGNDPRGQDHMIELLPSTLSVTTSSSPQDHTSDRVDLGSVQLTGEIADSKCYFGVMNPGNGKVHRDCAVRCISGGIPPAFLVRDARGGAQTLLLANWKREWLDHVAEPVTIRGRLVRSAGRLTLYAE
jgi:hypothetical protein